MGRTRLGMMKMLLPFFGILAFVLVVTGKEKELPPQPYQFEYGVNDQYSGAAFQAAESQSDKGEVYGEYKVNLPDGRVQTVSYRADPVQGFVADVKYEGEAVYPPEPKEGYGANK